MQRLRTPVSAKTMYESGSWWNNGLSQTDEWPCVMYFLRNLLSKISKRPINSVHIRDQGHTAAACSELPMTVTGQTPGVSSFSTVSEHSLRTRGLKWESPEKAGECGRSQGQGPSAAFQTNKKQVQRVDSPRDF